MNTIKFALAFAALGASVAPALADPHHGHGGRGHDHHGGYHDNGYHGGRYDHGGYHGGYRFRSGARRLGRGDRVWRGRDGRYYCRRSNGTTGLIVGAIAGGTLVNALSSRHDATLGTLVGAGAGGLIGRSIDRGNVRCR